MDVVALTDLATSADTEAPLLAHDLGVTAFEARQKLAAGLPCVVLFAPERGRTLALLDSLRRRGHGALAFDSAAVVASSAMVAVRRFHLDGDALVLDAAADGPQGAATETRVSFADIDRDGPRDASPLVETHEESKEKKFRPAAAIATGGLVLTKTVKRDIIRTAEERVQVLYIFRRGEPRACSARRRRSTEASARRCGRRASRTSRRRSGCSASELPASRSTNASCL